MIHAKDLLREVDRLIRGKSGIWASLQELSVLKVAMKPYFVPETTTLDEQMRQFPESGARISRWWWTNMARCAG